VDAVKIILTKKGEQMSFVNLEDASGKIEVVVFSRAFEKYKDLAVDGALICVSGKFSNKEGEKKIIAEKIYALTLDNISTLKQSLKMNNQAAPQPAREIFSGPALQIKIIKPPSKELIDNLRALLQGHPGDTPVYLVAQTAAGAKKISTELKVRIFDKLKQEIEKLTGPDSVI
jgi:DNA polymerase-3 subunit alpha